MSETFYVSRKSYEKLRQDLEDLKKLKTQLSEEIGEAARQGDLKENAEYHAEARIGATVTIEDLEDGEQSSYTLVGSMESNPEKNLLSVKAPVAAALLGKKEGDVFEVILPRAKRKYKLIKMEYK